MIKDQREMRNGDLVYQLMYLLDMLLMVVILIQIIKIDWKSKEQ